MKNAFSDFDKDGSGALDKEEILLFLKKFFKDIGIPRTPEKKDIDEFFARLAKRKEKVVGFDSFKEFMCDKIREYGSLEILSAGKYLTDAQNNKLFEMFQQFLGNKNVTKIPRPDIPSFIHQFFDTQNLTDYPTDAQIDWVYESMELTVGSDLAYHELKYVIVQAMKNIETNKANKGVDIPFEVEAEIKRTFSEFDRDSSGYLDHQEIFSFLQLFFHNIGMDTAPTQGDVVRFFTKLDRDNSGQIDYPEFRAFIISQIKRYGGSNFL